MGGEYERCPETIVALTLGVQAFFDSVPLATFDLSAPRRLVMQPLAHRFFDHIVVAVLLMMREKEDAACARAEAGTAPASPLD